MRSPVRVRSLLRRQQANESLRARNRRFALTEEKEKTFHNKTGDDEDEEEDECSTQEVWDDEENDTSKVPLLSYRLVRHE